MTPGRDYKMHRLRCWDVLRFKWCCNYMPPLQGRERARARARANWYIPAWRNRSQHPSAISTLAHPTAFVFCASIRPKLHVKVCNFC